MIFTLEKLLKKENIEAFGILPYEKTEKINPSLLSRRKIDQSKLKSVIIFTLPYYTQAQRTNISKYAVARDYHHFIKLLESSLGERLRAQFPNEDFYFFADNSPIDERSAAQYCNLGKIGKNGLLITEKYSSFVFIGEILTTASFEERILSDSLENPCVDCNLCLAACPKEHLGVCLSALTQKKGKLDENEEKIIKKYGSAWGCDICQDVCPVTKAAIKSKTVYSPIPYFNEKKIPYLSKECLNNLSDEEFSLRAYSWRKRETVLRNIEILEKE